MNCLNEQPLGISYRLSEANRKNLNLLIDLVNRQLTTILLLKACLFRKESRGGHFRRDIPVSMPFWKCHSRQIKGQEISTRPVRQ